MRPQTRHGRRTMSIRVSHKFLCGRERPRSCFGLTLGRTGDDARAYT
jgi:hypothetical protein